MNNKVVNIQGYSPLYAKSATPILWVTGDAGSVSSWTDQGPAKNHYLQANGSKQPTINASGVNGKPTFQFASTQFMQTASFTTITTDVEMFIVMKFTDAPGSGTYVIDGQASNQLAFLRTAGGLPQMTYVASSLTLTSSIDTTGWHLYNLRFKNGAGPKTVLRADDRVEATNYGGTPSVSVSRLTVAIAGDGASLPTNCQIRQILISSGLYAAGDRASIAQYMKNDAGIL